MTAHLLIQNTIVAKFILPFLLIFFIVFALLEKTKIFGESKQINSLVAFVIGLIFVSVAFPKEVVSNLILFLTVAIIVMFVTLLLWGFAVGGEARIGDNTKKFVAGVIVFAVIIAVLWAVGLKVESVNSVFDFLFYSSWSATFWTNVLFILAIAGALAFILLGKAKES